MFICVNTGPIAKTALESAETKKHTKRSSLLSRLLWEPCFYLLCAPHNEIKPYSNILKVLPPRNENFR